MRRHAAVVGLVVLLAAGCAAERVEPAGLTASPSPTVAATSTPAPTLEPSDPELGIVFEDVPELTDQTQIDVYNLVAAYQKEYWRMMTTNVVSPGFDVIASPEIRTMMHGIAEQNAGQQLEIGGVFHTRIGTPRIEGERAEVLVCDDYRDVAAADPNGNYTSEQVGLVGTAETIVAGPSGLGTWRVLDSIPAGAC